MTEVLVPWMTWTEARLESVLFKGVASSGLSILCRMDTHSSVYGQHKLDLVS